ncbi:MAG: hypothetical protein NZ703_13260 [Gemmataceae bacterium]|nr:hypothetical protein [Gemmataceae bacterium]MCS7272043.1 hypothetical protein [Gemmataceae bacterium]MDW8241880.1 hypothetical protein [Thermogemmata sp.]
MAEKVKSGDAPAVDTPGPEDYPTPPYPPYRPVYGWVFQAWLVMFLAVICLALLFYLLAYIPW